MTSRSSGACDWSSNGRVSPFQGAGADNVSAPALFFARAAEDAAAMERCELCGAERWRTDLPVVRDYISDESFAIRRCESCGLCVTEPFVGDDRIERYYPPRYRTDRQKYSGGWRTKRRADAVQRHFDRDFRGRLLDLGCGTGAFAMEMK